MKNNETENFFRELAQAYVEKESAALREELEDIERENKIPQSSELVRKIKNKIAADRFRRYSLKALPFAASLIIAVFVYNGFKTSLQGPPASSPAAPYPAAEVPVTEPPAVAIDEEKMNVLRYSIEFVSANLPAKYRVTGVDYDHEIAIMEILNDDKNRIVLTTEEYSGIDTEMFSELTINGAAVYGLVKNDYSVLKYRKDTLLYTLTSMYGYKDLIEISESII